MPCSRSEGVAMVLDRTFHDGHGWDPSPAETPSRKGLWALNTDDTERSQQERAHQGKEQHLDDTER